MCFVLVHTNHTYHQTKEQSQSDLMTGINNDCKEIANLFAVWFTVTTWLLVLPRQQMSCNIKSIMCICCWNQTFQSSAHFHFHIQWMKRGRGIGMNKALTWEMKYCFLIVQWWSHSEAQINPPKNSFWLNPYQLLNLYNRVENRYSGECCLFIYLFTYLLTYLWQCMWDWLQTKVELIDVWALDTHFILVSRCIHYWLGSLNGICYKERNRISSAFYFKLI